MKIHKYVLAALSGLSFFLVFPNFLGWHLWPLAWVCLVPLLAGLSETTSPRQAALVAAAAGLAGYPLLYHWLVYTMNTYGRMSIPVSVFVLMALVAVLSLFLAVFGALYYRLIRRGVSPLLAAPLVWVAIDLVRAHFPFGGFPWAFLANSQEKFLAVLQISEITGPYGVTFAVVLVNASLFTALRSFSGGGEDRVKKALRSLAPGAAALALLVAYGLVRIPMVDRSFSGQPEVKVGIVQGNVDQAVKWSRSFFWRTLQDHVSLTRGLLKEEPRLVIWPEASITVSSFNEHLSTRSAVVEAIEDLDVYLLVGSLSGDPCRGPDEGLCHYNSAYLLSPGAATTLGRYDKMRLVPFSEYVPLAKVFFFAETIAQGNVGSTTPGGEVRVFTMPGLNLGCLVCYEVIFPHLARKFPDQGARFMTTITNDAWFGKTGAPYQHHSNVILRAIENRVYFARSANTGISSIVDPAGRVMYQSDLYVEDSFVGVIRPAPGRTFYTVAGDVFAYLCVLALILLAAVPWTRDKGAAPADPEPSTP